MEELDMGEKNYCKSELLDKDMEQVTGGVTDENVTYRFAIDDEVWIIPYKNTGKVHRHLGMGPNGPRYWVYVHNLFHNDHYYGEYDECQMELYTGQNLR